MKLFEKVFIFVSCRYERQKKKALLGERRGSSSIDNAQKVKPSLGFVNFIHEII
jgi:hypothetical protein